ncbi:ribosomal-protein-alanine N-acetyltransferase [Siphonobacter sp. SORGH_AS 1065]|nr:ribosomal-protein-alanine N-acetyltransferase [Siphonobacter sp. SORGH_AS_1065]
MLTGNQASLPTLVKRRKSERSISRNTTNHPIMVIRTYQSADYAGCMKAFESNCPAFFADHEKELFQHFLRELEISSMNYYVVEHENQIIACAGFYLPSEADKAAELVWGMVTRDFQREGVGKQLLVYRLRKIQEIRPGTSVLLDTTQLSFPFFEKAGFRTLKISPNFYALGLDRYDMILEPYNV